MMWPEMYLPLVISASEIRAGAFRRDVSGGASGDLMRQIRQRGNSHSTRHARAWPRF